MHVPAEKPHCFKTEATPYLWKLEKGGDKLQDRKYIGEPVTVCGNAGLVDHLILNPMCVGCARLP